MEIENKYKIGDIVFLITDPEQKERIVTGIVVRPNNVLIYHLTCGEVETSHYELEMALDKKYV